MNNDNINSLENLEENADLLTLLLRSGGRNLISKAVQVELAKFLLLPPYIKRT
jgi:hypothetical protein